MPRAYLRDPDALSHLQSDLKQFAHGLRAVVRMVQTDIQETQSHLQERKRYWEREVQNWTWRVAECEQALKSCLGDDRKDRGKSCQAEEHDLEKAIRRLDQARQSLEEVKTWIMRVDKAVTDYQRHAGRIQQLEATHLPQASARLSEHEREARAYLRATLGAGMVAPTVDVGSSASPSASLSVSSSGTPPASASADVETVEDEDADSLFPHGPTDEMTPHRSELATWIGFLPAEGDGPEKGDVFELFSTQWFVRDPAITLLFKHEFVTSKGFDPVFFDSRTNEVLITEMKNWGTATKQATVDFKNGPTAWNNMDKYMDPLAATVATSKHLAPQVRERALQALEDGRWTFVMVTGPYTHLNSKWESQLKTGLYRHIPFKKMIQDFPE